MEQKHEIIKKHERVVTVVDIAREYGRNTCYDMYNFETEGPDHEHRIGQGEHHYLEEKVECDWRDGEIAVIVTQHVECTSRETIPDTLKERCWQPQRINTYSGTLTYAFFLTCELGCATDETRM